MHRAASSLALMAATLLAAGSVAALSAPQAPAAKQPVPSSAVKHPASQAPAAKQPATKMAAAKAEATQPQAAKQPEPKQALQKSTPQKHASVKHLPAKRVAAHHVAHGISVPLDEVRIVQFSTPVSVVYVGNPTIADVTMIDSHHAFVLGKGFGSTNLVALDAEGKQAVNDPVSVSSRVGSVVTLQRGPGQVTYACAGFRCETSPTPGDDKDSFEARTGQLEKHQEMSLKAASEAH